MTETLVSARDIAFLLYEILDVEALCARPPFAEHSRETFDAALATARQIAEEKFLPHFRLLDEEEPRLENGRVVLPPELGEALKAAAAAGFIAAHFPPERGGMQLPWTVAQACNAHFKAANAPSFSYLLLTIAAVNLIDLFGTEAQKARYLEPMLTGRFLGTMVLTEPNAGSSLGDLSSRAAPLGDGSFRITGTKIFISGGEHELSENIVHLVLARIAGAPKGPKGISVFIVPRYRLNADGSLGPANDVKLLGLIHKMGWRGTTSTMLAFGENGDCRGELLGRPNEG
ncbi:MAG TPA: acyl-CoA dehydrogenase family protein, partial [Alphaproteobacteria bacterium]|nr:acyl-CoA dehydrogenase family protein [Alphaproteobacteria bacterium]